MTKAGLIACALMGVAATASAAPQCYRTDQAEAEQAMRYQAKLMVLSDTCHSSSYSTFVNRNRALIISYQHALIDWFRKLEGRHAEDAFDRYQTKLANQYALGAGNTPVATLCGQSAAFLDQARDFRAEDFRHYITRAAVEEHSSYPRCTQESAEARRSSR
ncbi:MAG TPA: hypothetical protein VJR47_03085 [Stellaceae bacterium]|nr:hypothetical protein [Stellaceae bacterium]